MRLILFPQKVCDLNINVIKAFCIIDANRITNFNETEPNLSMLWLWIVPKWYVLPLSSISIQNKNFETSKTVDRTWSKMYVCALCLGASNILFVCPAYDIGVIGTYFPPQSKCTLKIPTIQIIYF